MLLHLIISNKAENSLNHDKSSQCDSYMYRVLVAKQDGFVFCLDLGCDVL